MRGRTGALTAIGMLAMSFLGGAVAQWVMLGAVAQAQDQAAAPQVIRAQAIVIVDEQGKEHAFLGNTGGDEAYWALRFQDAAGHDRFLCGVRADGTGAGLGINDVQGTLRVGLGAAEIGAGLSLKDEAGRERLGMGLGPGGGGDFVMKDARGDDLWRSSWSIGKP